MSGNYRQGWTEGVLKIIGVLPVLEIASIWKQNGGSEPSLCRTILNYWSTLKVIGALNMYVVERFKVMRALQIV